MARTRSRKVAGEVVAGAGRVLARQGPAGLTIRAVASEAGTSPQSIYNRFGSLDAVIDDLATDGLRRLRGQLVGLELEPLSAIGDPLRLIVEILRRYRRFARAEPELDRLLFEPPAGLFEPSPRTTGLADEIEALLVAAVSRAIAARVLLPAPADHVAWRLWSAARGATRHEMRQGVAIDDTRRFDATIATMIRGLRPRAQLDREAVTRG